MVQVLRAPERPKSPGEAFLEGIGMSIPGAVDQYFSKQQQQKQASQRNETIKRLTGEDLSGLPPEMQQAYVIEQLKGKNKLAEYDAEKGRKLAASQEDHLNDEETINTIRKNFGDKHAELYKAAPTGGKTELYRYYADRLSREGEGAEQTQGLVGEQASNLPTALGTAGVSNEDIRQEPKSTQRVVDYDIKTTPRERTRREDARYSKNLPLHQDLINRKKGLESEKTELSILEDLSPQIGFTERLNINPQTGDLLIPAAASPEAQRFIKTINDMTRNAKDTYGARVTNFDLTQFMKRLPSLANSEEGRRQIIEQLQLINKINLAQDSTLLDTLDDSGGIRKIDFDVAQSLSQKKSKKDVDRYVSEFKNIGRSLDKQYNDSVKEKKAIVPKGKVAVQKADGSMGYIDKDKVQKFLSADKENKVL